MGGTLYLECGSGISGDMLVGALLDLGGDEGRLREALASLPVAGFEVCVSRRTVRGIVACDFDVVLDEEHENHDHDMAWLFGEDVGTHEHHHEHQRDHHHEHHHGHRHEHDHGHHHEHRTPADVEAIIDAGALSPRAKATARRVFRILAEAEAKAHGVPVDQVHYHEVGAVDSIVDVISAAVLLDDLDITKAIVSPLAEGEGEICCAHGLLPVPVPAVANIVAAHGLVLARTGRRGEFVTPTGAAIAAAIRTTDELPAAYRIRAVGVGSGKRAYDPPSILRAMLIEDFAAQWPVPATSSWADERPHLWKLETEVDDCTGEALGHVMSRLYEAGANEVHFLPVTMKKGRPGVQLEVLCGAERIAELERIIFGDTTTIGIRRTPLWRTALPREEVTVTTCFGEVRAKRVTLPEGVSRAYPEHDSVVELAKACHVPYQDVYRAAIAALEE